MKRFAELPTIEGTDERHCWHEFGEGDEFGSLNRIGPDEIRRAATLVRSGRVFSLTLPLDQPAALTHIRPVFTHHVLKERNGRDDSLDGFYLSASSQWDGLRHVRFRQHGYYGGREEDELDDTGVLGMDRVGGRGIVGRAVLIDVPRHAEATGDAWDPLSRTKISPETLEACLERQQCRLSEGDVLLIRTGWLAAWLDLPAGERPDGGGASPGLDPDRSTAEWLWDHGVAAVAADNLAVEPTPIQPATDGFLHYKLLPLLGMLLGEQFDLEALARDCAEDHVYEGMFTSAPLRIPGGVCSPPNACVVK